jgi:hypothetical protein
MITAQPGKFEDCVRSLKRFKIPEGIVVREFLGLFGEPDAMIVFEAESESIAVEFVSHLACYVDCRTSLALPIDEFKWTR